MIREVSKHIPVHYLVVHGLQGSLGRISVPNIPVPIPLTLSTPSGEGVILQSFNSTMSKYAIDTLTEEGTPAVPYTSPTSSQHIIRLLATKNAGLVQTLLNKYVVDGYLAGKDIWFSFISPNAYIRRMYFTGRQQVPAEGDGYVITLTFTEDMSTYRPELLTDDGTTLDNTINITSRVQFREVGG